MLLVPETGKPSYKISQNFFFQGITSDALIAEILVAQANCVAK